MLHGNVSAKRSESNSHSPATIMKLPSSNVIEAIYEMDHETSGLLYSNQLPPTAHKPVDNSVENLTPSHFYTVRESKTDRPELSDSKEDLISVRSGTIEPNHASL